MLKKIRRRLTATAAALALCLIQLPLDGAADEKTADVDTLSALGKIAGLSDSPDSYDAYARTFGEYTSATKPVRLSGASFDSESGSGAMARGEWMDEQDVLLWESGDGSVSWRFTVPEDALYGLRLVYRPMEDGLDIKLGIQLDGTYPFSGLETVTFFRAWKNAEKDARTDAQGNELTPEQVQADGFIQQEARDSTGMTIEPYMFSLSAGEHTLTLLEPGQPLAIAAVELIPPENVQDYASVAADYTVQPLTSADPIILQGEDADVKSTNSLVPKSDTSDAGMSPSSPYITKLNYIGGTSWQSPGETLVWNFSVKEAGYYCIGFRYKQSEVVNGEGWRWMKIDGVTPFEEAKRLRFSYNTGWQFSGFEDSEGEPYYIWLDSGNHQLSLEVTLGELAEYSRRMSDIVRTLGDEYIKIVQITGESPDVNRDYELFRQIPDFNDTLQKCSDELTALAEDLKSFTGKRSSQYIAAINNMVRVLQTMLKSPYASQYYVSDYYTNYTSLSSWLYEMKSMPLSLDEIQIVPAGADFVDTDAGFFDSIIFGIRRLAASFTRDYRLSVSTDSEEELRLWVNWGRDQAMVLNSLIQDTFTPETGISVRLEIVNTSLVNGILSGNYPDVALFLSRTEPVNLGMRGALHDLSGFSDYKEVLERFQKGADIPYWYGDSLYALPDSQNFYIMFYRKDILESLSLTVPRTWDDFLYTSTIIQRNNMKVYIPYTQITTTTTVNSGIGSLNLFATLMCQNDLSLYNSDQNATALNNAEAVRVFNTWTELYTDYQFVKEADFYNRFRAGTMPLGLAPYSLYLTLYQAAPEIEGRWGVANVPGVSGGSNAVAGSGTGCAIIEKSDHHEAAWEFLKWWTSAETQTRYSRNLESILGMIGRPQTATVDAFKNMAWPTEDFEALFQQWEAVQEIPEIPGSYYVTRAVDQAFWAVINQESSVSDAVAKWSRVADSEIQRKIEEYQVR